MGYHTKTRTTHISLDLNSALPGDVEIVYERSTPRSPRKTIHKTERHLLIGAPSPDTMPQHIPTALPPPRQYAQHYYVAAPPTHPAPQIVYTQPPLAIEAPRTAPGPVAVDTDTLARRIADEVVAAKKAAPAPAPHVHVQLIQTGQHRSEADLDAARRALREQEARVAALQREREKRDEADRERGRRLRLEDDERRARSVSVSIRGGRHRSASVATDENGTRVVLKQKRVCDHCGYDDHRSRDCSLVVRRDEVVALVPPPWEGHRRSRSVNVIGYGEERPRGTRYIGWSGSQW